MQIHTRLEASGPGAVDVYVASDEPRYPAHQVRSISTAEYNSIAG
jgi:hypothetical protein